MFPGVSVSEEGRDGNGMPDPSQAEGASDEGSLPSASEVAEVCECGGCSSSAPDAAASARGAEGLCLGLPPS